MSVKSNRWIGVWIHALPLAKEKSLVTGQIWRSHFVHLVGINNLQTKQKNFTSMNKINLIVKTIEYLVYHVNHG